MEHEDSLPHYKSPLPVPILSQTNSVHAANKTVRKFSLCVYFKRKLRGLLFIGAGFETKYRFFTRTESRVNFTFTGFNRRA